MSDEASSEEDPASLVRPYIITGGETQASSSDLPIEAVVATAADAPTEQLVLERGAIADLCTEPTSIAEVAAELHLPLGVARFLVTDLAARGYLTASARAHNADADLLKRLIEGIRAL